MVAMISMAHCLRPATPRGDPEFPANYYLRLMARKAANVSDVRVPRHRDLFYYYRASIRYIQLPARFGRFATTMFLEVAPSVLGVPTCKRELHPPHSGYARTPTVPLNLRYPADAAGTGSSIHPEPTRTTVRILSSQVSIVPTQAQMHLLPGCRGVVLNSNQY